MTRIKTTLVGSYPVPEWYLANPTAEVLLDATRAVVNIQETAGIDVVCDGELSRFDPDHPEANGMIEYFTRRLDGIRVASRFSERTAYRAAEGTRYRARPPGIIEGPLGHGSLDLQLACARARAVATHDFKFTLTGPHMLSKVVIDRLYNDREALADAFAGILAEQVAQLEAEVIQIDEANLPGHPEEWPWAARAINRVLDAVKGKAAVHLCFGNYGGNSVQKGTWDNMLSYLNSLHADHVVLEMAHRPQGEIAVFRDLRPGLGLGLGVVDVKRTETETAEDIAHAIERAEKALGPGRVTYIHPDCGFSKVRRFTADAKIRVLAKGRDLYEGGGR